jgi:hypothetical protein
MQRSIWFKAKRYGWGWTSATWQGWLITAAFLILIVLDAERIDAPSHSVSDTLLHWIPDTFILVALLIAVCWWAGEKPGWRWGGKGRND